MRRILIFALIALFALPVSAQENNYPWCGYVLIENLVIEAPQLEKLAMLFPDPETTLPNEAMGVLQSDDGYTTLIDGCWLAAPERTMIVSLIEQADGLSYEDADLYLVYFEFAPGESHEASAAAARAYLSEPENLRRFNGDPEDDYAA